MSPAEMDGVLGAIGRLELTIRQFEAQIAEKDAEIEALKAGGEQ